MHITSWKKTFHIFPNRKLTNEEWFSLRSLPKIYRFNFGEEVGDGMLFREYAINCHNGIFIDTIENISKRFAKQKQIHGPSEAKRNYSKDYYNKNREKILQQKEEYRKINIDRINDPEKVKKRIARMVNMYRTNPRVRIMALLRGGIRDAVNDRLLYNRRKDDESVDFLLWLARYSNIDIKNGYDIDHIIPISKSDLTTKEGQEKINRPENIRWMRHKENISKHARMPQQSDINSHLILVDIWRKQTLLSCPSVS